MDKVALIFMSILGIWKLFDLMFPEKTVLGKRLVKKIIELKLLKAFYKDFLYDIISKDTASRQTFDEWLTAEYESWLEKKVKTGELSDIIKTKE